MACGRRFFLLRLNLKQGEPHECFVQAWPFSSSRLRSAVSTARLTCEHIMSISSAVVTRAQVWKCSLSVLEMETWFAKLCERIEHLMGWNIYIYIYILIIYMSQPLRSFPALWKRHCYPYCWQVAATTRGQFNLQLHFGQHGLWISESSESSESMKGIMKGIINFKGRNKIVKVLNKE